MDRNCEDVELSIVESESSQVVSFQQPLKNNTSSFVSSEDDGFEREVNKKKELREFCSFLIQVEKTLIRILKIVN